MEYWIYRVSGIYNKQISVAIDIDIYYWGCLGRSVSVIGTSKSLLHTNIELISSSTRRVYQRMIDNKIWSQLEQLVDYCFHNLQGRALLWPELYSFLRSRDINISTYSISAIIQILLLKNKLEISPAVTRERCNRCLADKNFLISVDCRTCNLTCFTCEQCLVMGKARSCIPFLLFTNSNEGQTGLTADSTNLNFSLTHPQSVASKKINDYLVSKANTKLLVWAVTGAGKTELLVASIAAFLSSGFKILWVTPRKDVVLELLPRVKQLLPKISVIALYGSSPDLWKEGDLVLATVHQSWRYNSKFSIVVIDEVDAFPLYGNTSMEDGIRRSLVSGARQVLLTATPPPEWGALVKRKELSIITLPIRYHGLPLPVPECFFSTYIFKNIAKFKSVHPIDKFLKYVNKTEGQGLIFVPRIADIHILVEWLVRRHKIHYTEVAGVSANDPNRELKILAFRNSKLRFLVTTTILERGITVPRCHVLVFNAGHFLFNKSSLVQIAGRVGRSSDYQLGVVYFLSTEWTKPQADAIKEIKLLNRLAFKEGFLRDKEYIRSQ